MRGWRRVYILALVWRAISCNQSSGGRSAESKHWKPNSPSTGGATPQDQNQVSSITSSLQQMTFFWGQWGKHLRQKINSTRYSRFLIPHAQVEDPSLNRGRPQAHLSHITHAVISFIPQRMKTMSHIHQGLQESTIDRNISYPLPLIVHLRNLFGNETTWKKKKPTNSPQTEEATWISRIIFNEVQLSWLNIGIMLPGWLRLLTDVLAEIKNGMCSCISDHTLRSKYKPLKVRPGR